MQLKEEEQTVGQSTFCNAAEVAGLIIIIVSVPMRNHLLRLGLARPQVYYPFFARATTE